MDVSEAAQVALAMGRDAFRFIRLLVIRSESTPWRSLLPTRGVLDNCRGQPIVGVAVQMADESHAEPHAPITTSLRVDQELCLARHFFDRRLPQDLPNIYANLLNGIAPIAEPIPLWRVRLCSACHIRRASGNHYGTRLLKAGDKLPPLPAVPPPFAN